MKYLNRKNELSQVEVGDEVMFLADMGDANVGNQGVVTEKSDSHITVQLAPKTSYEQENASLRKTLSVTEEGLDAFAFSGDLKKYEPTPKPEAKEEVQTDEEKKDGDDTTSGDTTEKKDDDTNASGANTQA